jgi:hypothetical protein
VFKCSIHQISTKDTQDFHFAVYYHFPQIHTTDLMKELQQIIEVKSRPTSEVSCSCTIPICYVLTTHVLQHMRKKAEHQCVNICSYLVRWIWSFYLRRNECFLHSRSKGPVKGNRSNRSTLAIGDFWLWSHMISLLKNYS